MSQLGVGVMIKMLCGNKASEKAFQKGVGKTIKSLKLAEDKLKFEFEDGTKLNIFDGGQSCCEHRYMQTDDDLNYYEGSILLDAEVKDAPEIEDEYGTHEVQFLEIKTSKGVFTMASHNEHNGYYGGFSIECEEG